MDLMDEKQITIMDEDGNQHVMEILFTYEHEERGKKYVFLYEKDNTDFHNRRIGICALLHGTRPAGWHRQRHSQTAAPADGGGEFHDHQVDSHLHRGRFGRDGANRRFPQ